MSQYSPHLRFLEYLHHPYKNNNRRGKKIITGLYPQITDTLPILSMLIRMAGILMFN